MLDASRVSTPSRLLPRSFLAFTMNEYSLHFAPQSENGPKYRLMELPKELMELIQKNDQSQISIRGRDDDDAVLCTADKTYSLRAVMVSNSFCVLTPSASNESGDAVIRATIDQILELSPSVPKLYRLRGLLRGCEYDEDSDDRTTECRMLADVKSELQASDVELEAGLRDMHILVLNGELRPMTPAYLNNILELILNALVSLKLSSEGAPIVDVTETLCSDHEIFPEVSKQVMSWFGTFYPSSSSPETWTMNVVAVVRQLGIGILSAHRSTSIDQDTFLDKWRMLAGDSFENCVDLPLLKGNYISTRQSATAVPMLSYFPSAELPANPSDRFTELFLVQPKWKAADIIPFLDDIAVDSKDRDKLLMKFTRNVTDNEGIIWYTSRGGTIA